MTERVREEESGAAASASADDDEAGGKKDDDNNNNNNNRDGDGDDCGGCKGSPSSSSFVPKSTRDYSKIEYWDKRFETEEEYEWCGRFEDFRELLVAALRGGGGGGGGGGGEKGGDGKQGDGATQPRAAKRVLVLGSGTSRLPFDLAAERRLLLPDLEEVVATDLSAVAVEKMTAKTRREEEEEEEEEEKGKVGDGGDSSDKNRKPKPPRAGVTWAVADMLSLPFPDASFDAVIDKGVLDALFAGFGSGGGSGEGESASKQRYDRWRPQESAPELWSLAQRALSESYRVLRPEGGCYIQVSFEQPHFRRPFLDAAGLSWQGYETAFGEPGGLQFFFYLRRRRRRRGGLLFDSSSSSAAAEIPPPPVAESYRPSESPMHAHMDEEDFLMRTLL